MGMKLDVGRGPIPITTHGPHVSLFPLYFYFLLAPDTTIENAYISVTMSTIDMYMYLPIS